MTIIPKECENPILHKVNLIIKNSSEKWDFKTDDISDWYHTFGELYKHRIALFIALCQIAVMYMKSEANRNWNSDTIEEVNEALCAKSKLHDDWTSLEWWFIMQLETPKWQVSYHLPMEYWDKCDFAITLEKAHKWDWHTSDDVVNRLLKI